MARSPGLWRSPRDAVRITLRGARQPALHTSATGRLRYSPRQAPEPPPVHYLPIPRADRRFPSLTPLLVGAGCPAGVSSLYGTVGSGSEVLGAIGGGALAATAGIHAPMLAGAIPIAGVITLLAWRHRAHDLPK